MQFPRSNGRELDAVRPGYAAGYQAPDYPAPFNGSGQGDTPLIHYWDTLFAHKGIIVLSIVLCVGFAALVTFSSNPVYQATGVLELQTPPSAGYARDGGVANDINGQTFDAYLDTQIGILESDTLIRRVMTRIDMVRRMGEFHPQGLAAVRTKYLHLSSHGTRSPEQLFETVKRNLNVHQSRLNNLIEVVYNDNDPKLAADFVNELADEYAMQNLEARWQMAQSAGNWLTRHLTDLRSKLEESENALQNYSQAHGILLVDDNESVAREKLHQLQEELSKAESMRMEKQAEMELAASISPDSVPQVLDNAALKEYEVKVADLERQLAELKQIYTPSNPKIRAIETQIASLQAAADKQKTNVLARLRNEFNSAQANEKMLATEYAKQNKLVGTQDEQMIHYNTLKHEVDSNRATYESLLQKVKETSVSMALQVTNVRVVDAAVPPFKPYKPNVPVNLAGGLLAGVVIGLTGAALRHRSSRAVRRPGFTQRFMAARELGVIPSARRGWPVDGDQDPRPALPFMRGKPDILRAWLNPNSPASESFRTVMTSLLFAVEDPGVRLLVVTSPGCGEGKTTVASNLGAAFAATGRRVLLVDADLRRPRLHAVFGLPAFPGVHEFASEIPENGGAVSVDRFVQHTGVKNLFLMASGDVGSSESSLVHTMRFRETFAALRRHFDMILVDAPPLPWVPESRVMARLADGVVMVVRAGTTRLEDAVEAERHIQQDGGILIGTVLNDAPQGVAPYYSRYAATASMPGTAAEAS